MAYSSAHTSMNGTSDKRFLVARAMAGAAMAFGMYVLRDAVSSSPNNHDSPSSQPLSTSIPSPPSSRLSSDSQVAHRPSLPHIPTLSPSWAALGISSVSHTYKLSVASHFCAVDIYEKEKTQKDCEKL